MDIEKQMIIKELLIAISKETQTFLNVKLQVNWKNSEQSRALRVEGNGLYAKASNALEMEETYKLYSQSIAFAENDSEELASAYGNRSAILFRMKKYKECIADIDLATKINNSDKFIIKLLCRKIKCINLQGLANNEEIVLEVESSIDTMDIKDAVKEAYRKIHEKAKNATVTKLGRSKQEEKQIPKHVKIFKEKENENPFDSVSIKWNKERGRYLVANRDFNAGEIVFFEKSYVKVPNLRNSHMYCGHCLVPSWATIPCNYCNWCMFCSEECKKISWKQYHSIECAVVSKIRIGEHGCINYYEQLAIRALILGIKDAGSIQNLKYQIESIDTFTDKTLKGFNSNGLCKSMGFQSMYTLNDEVASNRLPLYATKSVFILLSLIKSTSLFDSNLECNLKKLLKNDEVLFIGLLLLKLFKISDINCQQLPGEGPQSCKYSHIPEICSSMNCCIRGYSIVPISSLINNSCHPQVTNVINNRSNFIVCSLRPIKKDSQIFRTYCGNYFEMPKIIRQQILRAGFNFTCNCEACKKNWPTIEELSHSLQRNHAAFNSFIFSKEKYHAYASDDIIIPLLKNYSNFKCTLNTVETLSKAISRAYKDLKHPSAALFKLENSMQGLVEKLYENCGI